jgi:hypothetical protein
MESERDKNRVKMARYRAAHPERARAVQRRSYDKYRAKYNAQRRARYAADPVFRQQKQTRWNHQHPENRLLCSARARAKTAGARFTLTLADIKIPPVCPVLGIPLHLTLGPRRNESASLDRINPKREYAPRNVAVISWRANKLKGDGTAEEHRRIAAYMESNAWLST